MANHKHRQPSRSPLPAAMLLIAALLAGCGGGGGGNSSQTTPNTSTAPTTPPLPEPGAPTLTGDTALDGYNWLNYRRSQLGLSVLARNSRVDAAALGHSNYLRLNNTVSHDQTPGAPGFTGATLANRLTAAGYALGGGFATGEVISATTDTSGFYQAEELITAIYHRFVMFEPVFKEVGTGAATVSGGYTYFTADLTATNGLGAGIGAGRLVNYPVNNQTNVPINFFSDTESPDPVANQNEVGYPVSVHADSGRGGAGVVVRSFTITPRGGSALNTLLLSAATDSRTSPAGAAIIPLSPLRRGTVYDVSFDGSVNGVAAPRTWSFTTRQ
ncbi:Cysteine-rich secretory protein family protein [Duganella sp. CF517]|uniref:CAP domain-containing protein n=1 Tax=Duganella sp. CF517 TaxID=1881038 RepID=UPI0008D87DF3|nr:CAP domain-containing protein [Duganella sp. CF517]SEO62729.1 Cysteine-rich secretory protein family protein [Duganella sp. CF517]